MTTTAFASLPFRRILKVSGADHLSFLQGIMTIDVKKLQQFPQQLIAGAFLNAKGRILYDVIVQKTDTQINIEVDHDKVEDLKDMLFRYKLRKKITLEIDEETKIFQLWNNSSNHVNELDEQWFNDPRPGHLLGKRIWTKKSKPTIPNNFREISAATYHQIRMASGLAESPIECEDELPFILNFDWWPNSLAFDKGCYTGQELVARTHFKGQVRKRIVPIMLSCGESVTDPLLPSFSSWKIEKTSEQFPSLKSDIVPIQGVTTDVGEGTLFALAPNGSNIGLAAFKEAQKVLPPGNSFQPTHQINLENGKSIKVCPIRPAWWPSVESI